MDIQSFRGKLIEKKMRITHPRIWIYQELLKTKNSVTIKDLYSKLLRKKKNLDSSTIYSCLKVLESFNMVFKIKGRYKLCEMEKPHGHIVCKACGKVVELDFSEWTQRVIESTGYQMIDPFYGICGACGPSQSN